MAIMENSTKKRFRGTVKWFDNKIKGFGFIRPDGSAEDIFVHISALGKTGLHTLIEGQKVSYAVITDNRGKTSAVDVELITDES